MEITKIRHENGKQQLEEKKNLTVDGCCVMEDVRGNAESIAKGIDDDVSIKSKAHQQIHLPNSTY
jgi:metal-sulfur cluster biosynthetic enzyme